MLKKDFILSVEQYAPISELSLEQKGMLLDVFFKFHLGEEIEINDPVVKLAFAFFKNYFQANINKYNKICEARSESGKIGKSKQMQLLAKKDLANLANASFAKKDLANLADSESESESEEEEKKTSSSLSPAKPETDESESENSENEPDAKTASCPYRKIIELYHEALPGHPQVKMLNKTRKEHISARWKDAGERLRSLKSQDSPEYRLAWFGKYFAYAGTRDLLTGRRALSDGRVYIADFDKLISPSCFVALVEKSKYRNDDELQRNDEYG